MAFPRIPPIGNPDRFWNKGVGELIGKNAKTAGKVGLVVAGTAAALYVGSKIVGGIRNSRKYQEPEPQQDPALDDPYLAMQQQQDMEMMQQQMMAQQQQPTLMGQQMVEGAHAQRVLVGRGQRPAAGVDAAAPAGAEQDGRSTVDGRPIEDLGAFRG